MQAPARERSAPSIVVPLERLDRAALRALAVSLAMSWDVTALHVDTGTLETARIRERWRRCGDGIALEILEPSADPLGAYLDRAERAAPVVVVLPLVAPRWRWVFPIVNRRMLLLARRLARRLDTIVVPSSFTV